MSDPSQNSPSDLSAVRESLVRAIEKNPDPALVDALLRVIDRAERQGDFDALQERIAQLERRVGLCESVNRIQHTPAAPKTGRRLG